MSEHEQPELQWEQPEEADFRALEETLDALAAPLLAAPDHYGGFRLAARRDIVEQRHKMVRWEYLWEDEQKSSHSVSVFYDGLQKKFYVYASGKRNFFDDVQGAIDNFKEQVDTVRKKHEDKGTS